jgi:soluble lytic murein transglycosylase-like protein
MSLVMLLMISCLSYQIATHVRLNATLANMTTSPIDAPAATLHREHSKELLGLSTFNDNSRAGDRSLQIAVYIHKRVKQLLPEPWRPKSARIARAIIEAGEKHGLDPLLIMAVIQQESTFNPDVVGLAGELGLMQMKPTTAASHFSHGLSSLSTEELHEVVKDPVNNIFLGTAYLAHLRGLFKGRGAIYLSAYNMGIGKARMKLRQGHRPVVYSNGVLSQYRNLIGGLVAHGRSPAYNVAQFDFAQTMVGQ